jgi:TfoX/Sxy family transcriptional regulator of competence genes
MVPNEQNEGAAMPFDQDLKQSIEAVLDQNSSLTAKPLFGGICYLVGGNMAFGIYRDNLIVRLGSPEKAQKEIDAGRALPFDITGKAMKGWVMIPKVRLSGPRDFRKWLDLGLAFAESLPSK